MCDEQLIDMTVLSDTPSPIPDDVYISAWHAGTGRWVAVNDDIWPGGRVDRIDVLWQFVDDELVLI